MSTLYNSVQTVYDTVLRPYLPESQWRIVAGVPVRDRKPLDLNVRTSYDAYKPELLDAIHDTVTDGDTVVEIGSRGVSTTHACWAGADRVIVYEAAIEMVETIEEVLPITRCEDQVDVRHALVGEEIDVFGSARDAGRCAPAELPAADVLVMDCEGAETSIIDGLEGGQVPTIVVETHPECGAETISVYDSLRNGGYDIVDSAVVANSDYASQNKRVLVAEVSES